MQTNSAATFADGVATRDPPAEALAIVSKAQARVVRVSEDEIADAIRPLLHDHAQSRRGRRRRAACGADAGKGTHRQQASGSGLILTGGNIDMPVMAKVLRGETPAA